MYFMGLSATRFLKHWPELIKEYKEISLHDAWIQTFKHSGEEIIGPKKVADRLRAQGLDPDTPPGEFQMRPLVYRMFVNAVEKLGVSVEFNRRIVDYSEDETKGKASCVTDDGKTYEADVIIAADGVGSKSQKLVGGQVRAQPSGRAMWRAAFPIEELDKNPKVKEFFKMMPGNEPIVRTWLGPSTYALTLTREDVMVWIMNHDVSSPMPNLRFASADISRSPVLRRKAGTTPSTKRKSSRAWTRCLEWRRSSGHLSSRSLSMSHHPTPSSTSNCFGETPSRSGLLQLPASSRLVTQRTPTSQPPVTEPHKLSRTLSQLLPAYRLVARKTFLSPSECTSASASFATRARRSSASRTPNFSRIPTGTR